MSTLQEAEGKLVTMRHVVLTSSIGVLPAVERQYGILSSLAALTTGGSPK